jgi:hypothetical protein
MSLLVQTLGTASVLLTFVGSYRFCSHFYKSSDVFPGLIAVAATIIYLIIFEYIILLLGIVTVLSPALLVAKWRGVDTPDAVPSSLRRKANMKGDNPGSTQGDGELDYAYRCPECSEPYRTVPNFCFSCGQQIGDDTQ